MDLVTLLQIKYYKKMEQNNKNIEIVIKVMEILAFVLIVGYAFFFFFPILSSLLSLAQEEILNLISEIYIITITFLLPVLFLVLFILKIIFRNLSYEDKKSAIILKAVSGILFIASFVFTFIIVFPNMIAPPLTIFLIIALWFIGCIVAMAAQMYFLNRKEENS